MSVEDELLQKMDALKRHDGDGVTDIAGYTAAAGGKEKGPAAYSVRESGGFFLSLGSNPGSNRDRFSMHLLYSVEIHRTQPTDNRRSTTE